METGENEFDAAEAAFLASTAEVPATPTVENGGRPNIQIVDDLPFPIPALDDDLPFPNLNIRIHDPVPLDEGTGINEGDIRGTETAVLPEPAQIIDFKRVEDLLEAVYPGNWGEIVGVNEELTCDFYSMKDDIIEGSTIAYHIDFKDVEISNKSRQSHLISNISVVLSFKQDDNGVFKFSSSIKGVRTNQSAIEHSSRYSHSHLPSSAGPILHNFCLGGGTEMAMMVMELRTEFDYQTFEILLFMLMQYIKYESIEGGPFMRMRNISYNSSGYGRYIGASDISNFCDKVLAKYANEEDLEFRLLFQDLITDKATTSESKLGYTLNLNLTKNPALLRHLVEFVEHSDHIVNYSEGNFIPKTIDRGAAEAYTSEFCLGKTKYLFQSKRPYISDTTVDEISYTLSPSSEGSGETIEDIDVPNRGFVKELERRLQSTYRMYLNVKQNY